MKFRSTSHRRRVDLVADPVAGLLAAVRDVHTAQRALFDDHIRLDRVAGQAVRSPGDRTSC